MKDDKILSFLYNTTIGRLFLRVLISPWISKVVGLFMDTKLSTIIIKPFIKKNDIDMVEFEDREYESFNDFFTRKRKSVEIDYNIDNFISPCDGYLSAYKISENSTFKIKNSVYTIEGLIKNKEIASKYKDGYCLVFRLSPKNYHRYCYIDEGRKNENKFIKGRLHTVRSVAVDNYKVFQTNSREWSLLETKNYGDIVQIEVGALLVGRICNYHQEYEFKRGEEKGKFEYGGSTIVLLVHGDYVSIDKYLLNTTKKNKETIVRIGQKIGKKK